MMRLLCLRYVTGRIATIRKESSRLACFIAVGGTCTYVQYLLLPQFDRVAPQAVANWLAFLVSAQLNFLLSYRFTWGDCIRKKGWAFIGVWLNYNSVVLLAALVNTAAFMVFRHVIPGPLFCAIIAATAVSTAGTYAANHFILFRKRGAHHVSQSQYNVVPASLE